MQEHFMKKSTKQLETAAAPLGALETAKSGGRSREEWLAIRRKAGRKINPETAEIMWRYGYALDPYGIGPELPEACQQLQRNYFARSPGCDIWVFFYDLPTATRHALWEKHGAKIAFRFEDIPDKETRAREREQREKLVSAMIEGMEYLYDCLDSGWSIEEMSIRLDIGAAGGALPESSSHKACRECLELIRIAREQGLDRNEAIAQLREMGNRVCENL
jgi:hypothetical protein